ncbi:MAG: hypothetical protein WAT14_08965 [Chitinophagaceae bacterium]
MATGRTIIILIIFIPAMLLSQKCKAQKKEDSKIIITVNNTENLYIRVKDIFVRLNFFVKDLSIRDSLITYPTEFNGVYVIGFAAINGNTVTLSGLYGLKKIDEWGYTNSPKNFNKIIYYKGNREWRILNDIATFLGGTITYER